MAIRTTVIGSFPKVTESGSDNLPGTIDRWQRQQINDAGLEQELQKVITRVVREQESAGLDLISDGQIRWEDLAHGLARTAKGIRRGALRRFFDNNVYYRRLELEGSVAWEKSPGSEEFAFASKASQKPVKVSLPGPLTLVMSTEPKPGQTREKLLALYTDLLKKEVQALEKAGAKEIQIDEPALDPKDPLLAQGIQAINQVLDGVQARKWVAIYFQDVSALLPSLTQLKADVLALDLVSAREKNPELLNRVAAWLKSGEWKGEVALGLIDARNTKLENAQEIQKQLAVFTQAVPASKVWLSPNSGLEFLPHEAAVKKVKLLAEAAQGA